MVSYGRLLSVFAVFLLISTHAHAMLKIRLFESGQPNVLQINNFAWTADGQYLIVTQLLSKSCSIWKNTGVLADTLQAGHIITSIAPSLTNPDIIALGLENGVIEIWNLKQKKKITELLGKHYVEKIVWSKDGLTLFSLAKSQTQSYLSFWSIAKSQLLKQEIRQCEIIDAQWPVNQALVLAEQNTNTSVIGIYQVDLQNKTIISTRKQDISAKCKSCVMSPDCKNLLVYCQDGEIRLYNAQGIKIYEWKNELRSTIVTQSVLSADSSIIITSGLDELTYGDVKHNKKKVLLENLSDLYEQLKKTKECEVASTNHMVSEDVGAAYIKSRTYEPVVAQQFAWSADNRYLAVGLNDNGASLYNHALLVIDMQNFLTQLSQETPSIKDLKDDEKKSKNNAKIDEARRLLKQKLDEKKEKQEKSKQETLTSKSGKYTASMHDQKKEYRCNQCNAIFSRAYDLALHQKNNHKK